MSMNEHGEWPDGTFAMSGPLPPIRVPVEHIATHALLKHAVIRGDELHWPGLDSLGLQTVSDIRLNADRGYVSMPPRVNLDYLVDETTDEEAAPFFTGRADDLQRYYTRCTDSWYLHLATFTAITIEGIRRYFTWGRGKWDEIGLSDFLYVRDRGTDSLFGPASVAEITELSPGAVEARPEREAVADERELRVGSGDINGVERVQARRAFDDTSKKPTGGRQAKRKVLYIDLDNTLVDFPNGIDRLPAHARARFDGHYDDAPGIFALMDPLPGALDAYRHLADNFDTYLLSTAPWDNPSAWQDKIEWVREHLGHEKGTPAYKRLILSHHKHLNRGHYLVDDRTANGADSFEGELLRFGTEPFTTWPDVTTYLLART